MFHEIYYNSKWKKYRSDKKVDLNYAEKQGKKDINNKDESTYFLSEDKRYNHRRLNVKIELPKKYYEQFKKANPGLLIVLNENNMVVKA